MYMYIHPFFFMACIIDRTYWVVEASWNAETKSLTSLNTITKFRAAHNIDREPRTKREILFHVVVLARSTTPSHAIYLGGRNGLAATFVNDSKFESSKGLPELAIVGSLCLIYSARPSSHSPCSLLSPPHPRAQAAARNTIPRATLDGPIVCGLWESICQRIFPFGYVRIRGGVPTHSWLIHTHHAIFYCIYIDSAFRRRKFFRRRYYDMNKRREFYRPRPSFSLSCDES